MQVIFVHGNFRQGCKDHQMVAGEVCLGRAETAEQYALCIMDSKPLVTKRPVSTIKGEVYEVSDETLRSLDRREGYPHSTKRERVPIRLADNRMVDAWLYFSCAAPARFDTR